MMRDFLFDDELDITIDEDRLSIEPEEEEDCLSEFPFDYEYPFVPGDTFGEDIQYMIDDLAIDFD